MNRGGIFQISTKCSILSRVSAEEVFLPWKYHLCWNLTRVGKPSSRTPGARQTNPQHHLPCRVCSTSSDPYGKSAGGFNRLRKPTASYGVALVMRSVGYFLLEKTIVACNGANSALARAVAPFGVRRGEGGAGEHSLQAAICSRLMKTLL
jgi:hypothetical protein